MGQTSPDGKIFTGERAALINEEKVFVTANTCKIKITLTYIKKKKEKKNTRLSFVIRKILFRIVICA